MPFLGDRESAEGFDVEQFNEYLSDIRVEVEILKIKTSKSNDKEVQGQLSKIDKAISGITEMLLEFAEKSGKHEITLTGHTNDKKTLVGAAIKQALVEVGEPTYNKVVENLYREYHCDLADSYEHPEYLNAILKQMFGNAHMVVVESIKKHLEKFNEQKPIQEFLTVISR
jgi:hypothetical protein